MRVRWYGLLSSSYPSPCHSFIHSFFLQHRLLDKTDASPIPEAYTSSASNASSQSATVLTVRYCLYNTLAVQKQPARSLEPVRAPSPLDPSMLLESEPARVGMQTACAMRNAGRPALVATLSSLLTTINVYLPSFGDVLGVLQALVRVVGCLVLPTPSGALLTAPSKAVSRHALWLHSKNHQKRSRRRAPISVERRPRRQQLGVRWRYYLPPHQVFTLADNILSLWNTAFRLFFTPRTGRRACAPHRETCWHHIYATACAPHDQPYGDKTLIGPSKGIYILLAQVTVMSPAHVNNGRSTGIRVYRRDIRICI